MAASGRNSSSNPPPPAKKVKFDHMAKLYEEVEAGDPLDVTLVVENTKLYAHKAVVTIVSDFFRYRIKGQLEGGMGNRKFILRTGKGVIDFPAGTSVQAAKAFIKVMYFKQLDVSGDQNLLLEVMSLCDQYFVKELFESCVDSVIQTINTENCLKIWEASFKMTNSKRLLDAAFSVITRNIEKILEESCTAFSFKLWRNILEHEGPEAVIIPENILFQRLLKWRNTDASRENEFQSLVRLIRFPLMDASSIALLVQPSGALSHIELSDLLCYMLGGGLNGSAITKFITHSRKPKIARNTSELASLLKNAKPGDFIQLLAGEYHGPFEIPGKITLKGAGPTTRITAPNEWTHAVFLGAHDVKISNLKIESLTPTLFPNDQIQNTDRIGCLIHGSRNILTNLGFQNCHLVLSGSHNMINELECESGYVGVLIENGHCNSITNASLNNLDLGIGMQGESSLNLIKDVKCVSKQGILIESNDNLVQGITYYYPGTKTEEVQVAVLIGGGCGNRVENVECRGNELMENINSYEPKQFSLVIETRGMTIQPKNNTVTNCGPGPVELGGESNYLKNVDAANWIKILGLGHKLENCWAGCSSNQAKSVEIVECNFNLHL